MWSRIKIFLLLLALAVISPLLHNLISGWLGVAEPVFFALFFVFFFGAIIYLLETAVFCLKYQRARGPKRRDRAFQLRRGASWLLMLGLLGLTWAVLHDISKGEPDLRFEYLFLTVCAFGFAAFTIVLFREKCK